MDLSLDGCSSPVVEVTLAGEFSLVDVRAGEAEVGPLAGEMVERLAGDDEQVESGNGGILSCNLGLLLRVLLLEVPALETIHFFVIKSSELLVSFSRLRLRFLAGGSFSFLLFIIPLPPPALLRLLTFSSRNSPAKSSYQRSFLPR